jgi:hypothetical protein
MQFEFSQHDFGTIQEDQGPVTVEFSFLNKGEAKLQITNVKASCDCTTPGWTRAEVAPGFKGYIKAQYNPANRPGAFKKTLTVFYTYQNTEYSIPLTITGFVMKGVLSKFPTKKGNLRFTSEYFSFYSISTQKPVQQQLKIYNQGSKPLLILGQSKIHPAYKLTIQPTKINPNDSAVVELVFDPEKRQKIGDVVDTIVVKTDDELQPLKSFYVLSTIHTYFPKLSREDSLKAPRISIPQSVQDVGTVKQGDTIRVTYELINTGKKDLKILSTSSSCACTISKPEKETIAPGEKTQLKVVFYTEGKSGKNTKQIYLYTNDPFQPEPILKLKSDIQAPVSPINPAKPDSTGTH